GFTMATGDFNHDGYPDLVVDAPEATVDGFSQSGYFLVFYGSSAGLSTKGSQLFSEDSPGIAGHSATFELFGRTSAVGDFNHDGFADVAVGVVHQTVSGLSEAGAVFVLYGSAKGLTATGSQEWTQDSPGSADQAAAGNHFGRSIAAA